jgi:hypothetical protein
MFITDSFWLYSVDKRLSLVLQPFTSELIDFFVVCFLQIMTTKVAMLNFLLDLFREQQVKMM